MKFRIEIWPFLLAGVLTGMLLALVLGKFTPLRYTTAAYIGGALTLIACGYFFWFFRNPDRSAPDEKDIVVAGADGVVAKIATFTPAEFGSIAMLAGLKEEDVACLKKSGDILRVSIFLSLFDVHVNRAPIGGKSRFLGYFPGKHLFTFDEKSSDVNQHNSILIQNARTCCLVNQIVGPVCRRVVYWLDHDNAVDIGIGEDFGMMKFGSRLDMYFPAADIKLCVEEGVDVRAGESIIGHIAAAGGSK
jgi:phosphatidylserine decarboxylase